MNETVNDSLRFIIGCAIRTLGAVFTLVHKIRIHFFTYNQKWLRRKYLVVDQTPVHGFGNELDALINASAASKRGKLRFPITSGSTGTPKRILFTRARLKLLKLIFSDFYVRCCWAFSIKRTSLYVFSSLSQDESLTSMLLEEKRPPSYFSTLQAPYRVQSDPCVGALRSKYGDTAVRIWILALSNPGVLYSTNPSTISVFFDELQSNWDYCSRLIRDWCRDRDAFDRDTRRVARKISSRGCSDRLEAIAQCTKAPSPEYFAPALASYICWTGGYVQPFLNRLEKYLPAARYSLIPMYSMSTETVETIVDVRKGSISFLPLAPRVLYEFREEDNPRLLKPHELQPGHSYSLIVSDDYGLLRYDTGDVFLCRKQLGNLPDLSFRGRRSLEYSFTGEKLTADQVTSAFEVIRHSYVTECSKQFFTCIPSQPDGDPIPHYKMVIVTDESNSVQDLLDHLSTYCDQLFAEVNCEYKAKRESGRLGPVRSVSMKRSDFLELNRVSVSWETQFKFLPLYVQTWEAMRKDEESTNHRRLTIVD